MSKLTSKHRLHIIALALVILTGTVYCRVLTNGFTNFDDTYYVTRNLHVSTGLTFSNLLWAFNAGYASNWHPLTWISHMADCTVFGLNPMGHHAVNLLFHLANTILLFLTLSKLTKSVWRSALVAALFAVHPLHVESVAWVAERKDVLSTLFWLLTMWAYIRYTECPGIKRYALVASGLALGLMAKPMLVTLPVILLLLDYWPLGRFQQTQAGAKKQQAPRHGWRLIREKLPLFGISAASGVLTFIAQRHGNAVSSFGTVAPLMRIENALVSYAAYIVKTVWPCGLAPFYPFPMEAIPVWKVAGAVLLLAGISVLVYRRRKTAPYLVFGWLWYLITLLPVIGLVQVGAQSMADRYTYVPLIGIFIIAAWTIPENTRRPALNRVLIGSTGIVILACSCLTWVQCGYWKDSITLFTHTMNVTEDNYTAYANLAAALADEKKYEEAEPLYVEALRFRSDTASLHFDYATTLYALGRVDEAVQEYQEALRLDPDLDNAANQLEAIQRKQQYAALAASRTNATGSNTSDAEAHMNRAIQLDGEGKSDEALREYKTAVRIDPNFAEAHANLGVFLRNKGDLDGAIREYEEAIRISPALTQVHMNLAIAHFLNGDYSQAWTQVDQCQEQGLNPDPGFLEALSRKMPRPRR